MRVVINGLAALKPKTGVGHHVASLTRALIEEFPTDEFWLYPGDRLARLVKRLNRVEAPRSPTATSSSATNMIAGRAVRLVKQAARSASRLHFAAAVRGGRFNLYHEPNFIPFRTRLPTVVTVHDLSVLRFPDWHPADRVRLHREQFTEGLRRAVHVIAVSESIRAELIDEMGLNPDQVTTVYNGINPAFCTVDEEKRRAVQARLGLPSRYVLCVGTIEPRKNIGTVMRAFSDLPPSLRANCPLILVGPWGWKSETDRQYFESTGRDRGTRHLGYVADDDLPAVYAGAAGLVYPSYYEGFGLPPVEMLACGGRVVASSIPAVREVCGPFCEYVDPHDSAGWQAALERLASYPMTRDDQRIAGARHAAQYSWVRAARQTMDIYKRVLGFASAPVDTGEPVSSPRPAA
jgi:alpha-1,3-rhamnosyl/mannosyltransferase